MVWKFSVYYISDTDAVSRAFNLGLAAILGKGVYNFGELVSARLGVCALAYCVWLFLASAQSSAHRVFERNRQEVAHRFTLCIQ